MFLSTFELSFVAVLIGFILNRSFPAKQSLQESSFVSRAIIPLKSAFPFLLSEMIVAFIRTFVVLFDPIAFRLLVLPSSIVIEVGDFVSIYACVIACTNEVTGIRIHKDGLVEDWLIVLLKITFEISLKVSIFLEFVKLNISLWSLIQPLLVSIGVNDVEGALDLPYLSNNLRNLCQFPDALLNVLIDHGKRCHFYLFFDDLLALILLLRVLEI